MSHPIVIQISTSILKFIQAMYYYQLLLNIFNKERFNLRPIFAISCAAIFTLINMNSAQAQTDLPGGKVEVVKSFDARLAETDKIRINAPVPQPDTSSNRYQYNALETDIKMEYEAPTIKPLAMGSEKLPPVYKGFAKAGIGFPLSPYAEGSYYHDADNFNILAHLRHHSANDKKRENQRFMDNDFMLRGNYYFEQGIGIGARTNYSLDDYYFYGYDEADTSFLPQYARRRFKTFDLGFSVFNVENGDSDLNYWGKADFYTHRDDLADPGSETGTLLNFGIKKYLQGKHPIAAEIITDMSSYTDTATYRLNNFFFIPSAAYIGEMFSAKGAIRIASHNDEFFFLPDLQVAVNLAEGKFRVQAGWDANLYKNSFRNLTDYNPFIAPILPALQNAKYDDFYAAIGGVAGSWNYELRGGYKPTTNMALYLPTVGDPTRFSVIYDTVNIVYAKLNLHTTIQKNLTVGLSAGYNLFNPTVQEEAWQIPALETNLSLVYRALDNKLRLRGEMYFTGGVPVLTPENEKETLNALFDVSLGADYMFTEKFGLFLNLNNLASNRWRRWFNYPTYGINVLGGLIVRF